ncbi:unnamed protein product [Tilletia laevis]|uniref:tRNA(Ile)-lysidine synthetase n=3 Tax=Tilletia TaxID=13289 RepID=A0A9N8LJ82_9BASI|nr:hypothetical protein CF336_g4353 [Tilletia laevis]KAE8260381.1 hypothetical protein A4X03_0g3838 [Tilletia caries]CAD6907349.1 unnamed protein product [Tilletia laevis]CAD6936488.1 unnamed protein product [Tilletia laevis]CAD6936828.1 unnamed protein product [Tilletia caries]
MPRRSVALEALRAAGQAVKSSPTRPSSSSWLSSSSSPATAASPSFEPRTSFLLPSQTPSWYPGHMQRALRSLPTLLARATPSLPLVIEVRDARLPLTSINPAFERMLRQVYGMTLGGGSKGKGVERQPGSEWEQRRLVVYTKRDLISPRIEAPLTEAFLEHGQRVMFVDTRNDRDVKRIHKWALQQARSLVKIAASAPQLSSEMSLRRLTGAFRHVSTPEVGVRIIIMGMPNVGKSTLLNALRRVGVGRGKAVATAPHPGHTRKVAGTVRITEVPSKHEENGKQTSSEADDPPIYVYDTPGIMVPFLGRGTRGSERGIKLALAAGIRTELFDSNVLADYLLYRFNLRYAYALSQQSQSASQEPAAPSYIRSLPLGRLLTQPTNDITELMTALAHRVPGALSKGGGVDLDLAANFMVQRWRDGKFGPEEGDLDLGLDECSGEVLAVDGEGFLQPALSEHDGENALPVVENSQAERIRNLVRQHFVEVMEADDPSRSTSRLIPVDSLLETDHDEQQTADASTEERKEMPVLLSNHQARKRAKQTYLESQREKYRAQGLIRDGPGKNSKNARRSMHTMSAPPGSRSIATDACDAITASEFAGCMGRLKAKRDDLRQGIALSISGGVDSMALAYLVSRWRDEHTPSTKIAAIVVDHRLRNESAEEAQLTAERLQALGLQTEIRTITWGQGGYPQLPAPGTAFEAVARSARRLTLLHFLRTHQLRTILFGHHADDQCETAVLRAMNGSRDVKHGLDGLGGMRSVDGFGAHALLAGLEQGRGRDWLAMGPFEQSLAIGRPLLPFAKSRLRATCLAAGVAWAEDPTNEDTDQNARNLVRGLLRDVEQDPSLVRKELNAEASRALSWCLQQAQTLATSAEPSPLDALRSWVRSVSDRRDDTERRVAQLFAKSVIRSGEHADALQVRLSQLPPETSDEDLKQLLRSVVNAASPHPLGSAAARGTGSGSDSPSSADALASRWLRCDSVTESLQKAALRSKPARTAVNGDVLLTARKVSIIPSNPSSDPPKSQSSETVIQVSRAPLKVDDSESRRLWHTGSVSRYSPGSGPAQDWRLWDGRYFVRVVRTSATDGGCELEWSIRPGLLSTQVLPRIYLLCGQDAAPQLIRGAQLTEAGRAAAAAKVCAQHAVRVDIQAAR